MVKKRGSLYAMLLTVFVTSLIVSFTSIGFPYTDNKSDPRLQRFRVIHTKRTSFYADGTEKFSDIGYLISIVDRNSERSLKKEIFSDDYEELVTNWLDDPHCSEIPNCGFSIINVFHPLASELKYVKSTELPNVNPVKFKIDEKIWNEQTNELTINFSAKFVGFTQIYLSVDSNWQLINSSILLSDDTFSGQTYKIGKVHVGKSLDFDSLEFFKFRKIDDSNTGSKVASLTLINTSFSSNITEEFGLMLKRFPAYVNIFEQQADSSTYKLTYTKT